MKDENKYNQSYEFQYHAYQNIDADLIFSYTESQLEDNYSFDKEEIEKSIRAKTPYCGYFWKRSRITKTRVLPTGTTVVDNSDRGFSSQYVDYINRTPKKSSGANRDYTEIYKDKFFGNLVQYFNNTLKLKTTLSKKKNPVCYDQHNTQIGVFYIGPPFFESKTGESEIIFYCDNEKLYNDYDIEDSFYDFLESIKLQDYQQQPISLRFIQKPKKINNNKFSNKPITRKSNG